MRHLFQVGGMRCASCQAHVAKAVKAVPGVLDAEVNLITGRMTVETDDAPDMPQRIVDAMKNAGFTAELVEEAPAPVAFVEHVFQVGGMRCASCQAHVAKAVKAVPGVLDAEVNLITGRMTVETDDAPDMPQRIVDAMKNAGFTAELVEEAPAPVAFVEHVFQVGGMRCASCQAHVAKAVKAVSGVRNVEVNLITGRMTVETDDAPEMPQKISDAVKNAGFTAEIVEEAPAPAAEVEHVFQVGGMRCASCQAHVAKAVKAVPGVRDAEVNLVTGRMTVKCGNAPDMPQKIIDAVKNAGFTAEIVEEAPAPETASEQETAGQAKSAPKKSPAPIPDPSRELLRQFLWSAILMLPLMYVAFSSMHGFLKDYPLDSAWLQLVFVIPLLFVNRVYFVSGARRFLKLSPNMDSLIMLGSGASVLYSLVMTGEMLLGKIQGDAARVSETAGNLYFETAGMILVLVTFGKYLEARAKRRTTDAVSRLMDLSPKTAVVVRGEKEVEIAADELAVGDVVVIRPGSSIPADGVVVSGNGVVDQSSVTGESVPAGKEPGDRVVSGTMNVNGSFRFRAERVGRDSTLSRIIQLVESASNSSAPISRFADRVSGVFVPVVLIAALAAGCVWLTVGHQTVYFALTTAIAVLVISCPCALGLATPIAIMVGTGVGSKYGVLFKNAAALEELHNVKTIVLDKTGTNRGKSPCQCH